MFKEELLDKKQDIEKISKAQLENINMRIKCSEDDKHLYRALLYMSRASLVAHSPTANAGDTGLLPGSGRSPGEGNGHTLQYSCLGNPVDRGA